MPGPGRIIQRQPRYGPETVAGLFCSSTAITYRADDAGMDTPPAWFPDPQDPSQWRWWDGSQWSEHRAPRQASTSSGATGMAVSTETATTVEVVSVETAPEPAATVARGFASRRVQRRQAQKVPTVADVVAELQHEPPRSPLDEQVEVAGETFHAKGIKRVFAEAGVPILQQGSTIDGLECILVPEPWNPHDRNAVAVAIGQHQVGYLPADLAIDYCEPLMELAKAHRLATGEARIWALDDGGVIRARVTILIPEVEAFDD